MFTDQRPPHERWMRRCLELARLGAASAAPNPMVGAVLVQGDQVLAEGWHKVPGSGHAEVECLRAFGDAPVPHDAVMYVNLEPCAHHGRTPPCADLLIERGVNHVVVGQRDPHPKVAGAGIAKLRNAGIAVIEGLLEHECRWTQRRFLTSLGKGRPYIVLKWARSQDGLLDQHPRTTRGVQRISSPTTDVLVHRWRAEEQAILVGSRTVLNDDPSLTVRHVEGRQPLRVVLDRYGITPDTSTLYTDGGPTLLFTGSTRPSLRIEQVRTHPHEDPIRAILAALHQRDIRSVLVEGGATLIGQFIGSGLWDEARVITGACALGAGTPAPALDLAPALETRCGGDRIAVYTNGTHHCTWDW